MYNSKQLKSLLSVMTPDIVQVPVNVFDQRLIKDGSIGALSDRKIKIHIRSIFLQGLMLMDESGSLKIEGWQADWGPQYEMLEPGNRVVITNIGIDGWAALDRGEMYRASRLHILHD